MSSRRPLMVPPAFRALVAGLGIVLVAYLGCTNDATNNSSGNSASIGPSVSGAGAGSGDCQFGAPNSACTAVETCDCPDCPLAAMCTGRCQDDGNCVLGGGQGGGGPTGEDCSCIDCYNLVPQCLFEGSDCNPDLDDDDVPQNLCTAGERCTCPDCTGTPSCQMNCQNNGQCTATEGCSCADCTSHPDCNGGPAPASASASTAASTVAASTAASTGAGGMGGAGGN